MPDYEKLRPIRERKMRKQYVVAGVNAKGPEVKEPYPDQEQSYSRRNRYHQERSFHRLGARQREMVRHSRWNLRRDGAEEQRISQTAETAMGSGCLLHRLVQG